MSSTRLAALLATLSLAAVPAGAGAKLDYSMNSVNGQYAPPATQQINDVPSASEPAPSRAHFSREFRRTFGESPHAYLLTRRLERAAALLRTTDHSVAEICFSVGLQSVGSFTTSFTRTYGMSPTAYRARFPPAADWARVPACIVHLHARPQHSTFREDSALVAD